MEDASGVDGEGGAPVLVAQARDGIHAEDAGDIHQNVDRTQLPLDPVDGFLNRRAVADIGGKECYGAALAAKFGG